MIQGLADVLKGFDELKNLPESPDIKAACLEDAKEFARMARSRVKKKTGNLRRAIKAKRMRSPKYFKPAAMAIVDRKIAPHAHLVENGTAHSAPHSFWRSTMYWFRGRSVTAMERALERQFRRIR